MTETLSACMRYGIGTSGGNDILNAMCIDIPELRAHGSTISNVRTTKETIRKQKVARLHGTSPGGKISFIFDKYLFQLNIHSFQVFIGSVISIRFILSIWSIGQDLQIDVHSPIYLVIMSFRSIQVVKWIQLTKYTNE